MRKLYTEEISRKRLTEQEAALPDNRFPVIAILDNIRSLYNVGSIFRTADGGRIESIYTVGYTPHPPRVEIEKTALGATRTVPHRHFDTVTDAITEARTKGFKIGALEITNQSRSIYELKPSDFPMALIIGNEVSGVRSEGLEIADIALEIPMIGAKHSLNAAVSFGIALYECIRVFRAELSSFYPKK